MYNPVTPDSEISLPSIGDSVLGSSASGNQLSESARQSMIDLIVRSHGNIWPHVDIDNFPSTQVFAICINLYHRHFHDWLPLYERCTFKITDSPPPLLMAMATIGAVYARDGKHRLGIALNELVRRTIIYTVGPESFPFDEKSTHDLARK